MPARLAPDSKNCRAKAAAVIDARSGNASAARHAEWFFPRQGGPLMKHGTPAQSAPHKHAVVLSLALSAMLISLPARPQIVPGGMASGGFSGTGSASTYTMTIRVVTDPGLAPYFWANQFWVDTQTDHGGYFGLQAVGTPGDGTYRRLSLFSIWNAVEARPAPGAIAVPFDGEGIGWSLRRPHDWRAGVPYTFTLTRHDDTWWKLSVSAPGEAPLEYGSIRVTAGAPLRRDFLTFTEYYAGATDCDHLPYAHVVFENPTYGGNPATATWVETYGNCQQNAGIYLTGNTAHAHRAGVLLARAHQSNFDGDAHSDILWRNAVTGANIVWRSANYTTQLPTASVSNLDWRVVGLEDFDGDDATDILWRNTTTGANIIWPKGNYSSRRDLVGITNLSWTIAANGDFDKDGKADIFWRNVATGANVLWPAADYTKRINLMGVTNMAWRVIGAGDFDGDGSADVLWHNSSTGAGTIWRSGNYATQQVLTTITNLAWKMVGIGDFNGDGKSDIFWRNDTTGANIIWLSGNYATQQPTAAVANLQWRVAAIGDYDGDGRSDVFWRNGVTGANILWPAANFAARHDATTVTNLAWSPMSF